MGGISGFDDKGQPVAVSDAAEADALFDSGKLKFARGQSVKVRSSDGRIFDLPAENYELARKAGASLVTDDEARTERKAEEIRDAGALAAFGRGAASTVVDPMLAIGANLGVTKDFRDISRDALKNQATDLEASEKEFAGATTGGKLFGYVAPTLLTAGANLGVRAGAQVTAKGLAAATAQRATVAGISNVAGETAAQLAVNGMAKLGAGKVATNVAKWSAQGGAEAVVQGASDAMVQATLDNPDKVAESMLASVGPSALYGAAGNVILGGIGKGLVRGATASKDAIKGLAYRATRGAAQELGEVNPVVLGAAESATARYMGAVDDAKAGPGAKAVAKAFNVDEADAANAMRAEAAEAIDNPERWFDRTSQELTEKLEDVEGSIDEIDDARFKGLNKLETFQKLAGDSIDPEKASVTATAFFNAAEAGLRDIKENAGAFEGYGALNKVLKDLDAKRIQERLSEAMASDNPGANVAWEMDRLKREIGYAAKVKHTDPGPIIATKMEVAKLYEQLRAHLEDRAVWGDAVADIQADVNEGWTQSLRQSLKYAKSFTERTGNEGFETLRRHDPKKIKEYIGGLGEFTNRNMDDALAERLEGARKRAVAYRDQLPAGDAMRAKAEATVAKIDATRDSWRRITSENKSRMGVEKVAAQAKSRAIFGGAIAAGAGMAAGAGGGESLAGGGMIGAAIANPALAARMLATARVSIGKRSGAILGAAGGVSNRARGIFEKAGKVAPRAGRALAGGALFLAYKDKVREIVDATTNTATVPELDAITPGLSGAIAAKRATALDFLKSKAPTGGMGGGGMFAHLETPTVTEYQARRFFEYVRGVEDPLAVLEEVRSGAVSTEAIEAVRAVYPETFAEMQQVVTEQLAGLKEPPPYESRLELYRVFGVASDRSLSPEFFASIQALPGIAPTEAPQQRPAGAAKADLGQLALSDTARMQSR